MSQRANRVVAGALAAVLAAATSGPAMADELSDSEIAALIESFPGIDPRALQAIEIPAEMKGKDVILRVGPGFSKVAADIVAANLIARGCPVTVTSERGLPKRIGVEVDGHINFYKESGYAGHDAIRTCLEND